ncbi:anti-sigma-F factor Fin family protein [Halalkalibacter oceani]|uniref:anti-sigma-F factor Fin family protein n=1 Tax=Halalkalibacter oceani TaxID=1653776 RepID=UPI0025596C84|nr:anti-sigma-F factor Fin family protein [Halalkalibacter oceani]
MLILKVGVAGKELDTVAIHYKCRHCQVELGAIDEELRAEALGFDSLTSTERTDMLTYEPNGDIHVNVICEDCHEALMRNPGLHELDRMIQ